MEHIPKDKLIIGKRYKGSCRNASEAIWTGTSFIIKRYKFGDVYDEHIRCPEDEDRHDVFYATEVIVSCDKFGVM